MQSFYITNNDTENKNFSVFKEQLLAYPKIKLKKYELDFFYSKEKESIFKKEQNFISNLGVFIYKNTFNKKKLKTRTLAISNSNFFFLKEQNILSEKINSLWKINKINIFNTKFRSGSSAILDFKNKKKNPIFYMEKYQ